MSSTSDYTFTRLMHFMNSKDATVKETPAITTTTAILLLILYTLIYVIPFYLSPTTRPSPTLSRDAPSVIRARIRAVSSSCALCVLSTLVFLVFVAHKAPTTVLHELGCWPLGLASITKSFTLTTILFLGPLFEEAIVNGYWRDWLQLRDFNVIIGSWIGWRNLVAGPITEEILFRSASIPLLLLAETPQTTIIYLTPLIFGFAHIHHFYEYTVSHPHSPLLPGIVRSLLQFSYTTLFGSYTTFIYLRTGSLISVILIHTFCNWQGLPRIWGRLERVVENRLLPTSSRVDDTVGRESNKRDDDDRKGSHELCIGWTIAYYVLLVTGAVLFFKLLFPLTESSDALAQF